MVQIYDIVNRNNETWKIHFVYKQLIGSIFTIISIRQLYMYSYILPSIFYLGITN